MLQPVLEAVIFDVDGVLVDSYQAHFRSWKAVAAADDVDVTEAGFARTFGQTSRDIIRQLWQRTDLDDARIRQLDDDKEARYREIIAQDFPAMDGAVELIDALHADGIKLAAGSSGPPANVELALRELGRRAAFTAAVTGMEVSRGKPDPEVFLRAAQRLGAWPSRCLVVEDAPAGIQAATAAGMAAVALLSTGRTESDFRDVRPSLLVRSLRELTPERLGRVVTDAVVTGYQQLDHPADLAFRFWAPSEAELLAAGARALLDAATDGRPVAPDHAHTLRIEAVDPEDRMVRWLNEVLLLATVDGYLVAHANIELHDGGLQAELWGRRDSSELVHHELKSVTYHDLELRQEGDRVVGRVVVDV
jgi:beta-phosphoglucomutase